MSLKEHNPGWLARSRSKPGMLIVLVVATVIGAFVLFRPRTAELADSYYTVKRGDFLISVVEGGTLQAVNEVIIRNEVEGTARIIYIVPEGSYVKKGDLLVELDSASAQDQVNTQLINVEKAQFALTSAEEQLEIQKSVVDSEVRAAELKLRFAKLDLEKFDQGDAAQLLTKAENEIATIKEKLAIDQEKAEWSEKLEKQGFETKSNLDRDRLTVSQTRLSYQMATNALWMLRTFDLPKQRETFESAVREAEKELERVKHQGTRKLAQYEADVRTQKITLDLSKSKLERDQKNLAAGKIFAPQDGLVVYAVSDNRFSSESLIEEGATVRNRQNLIKLPDVSEMKLSIKIHESHINMITLGQPAFIVLDSMPDQRFRGVVSKVGLLPDTQSRWGNPNLKLYATEIMLRDKLPDIKPGVSARAEVIITNLQNVISVPLQAVTTLQGRQVVYLADGGDPKPVNVSVGLYNTKFIEIASGLQEGQRILLAPPFDTQQKDLGGAIVGEGEEIPATNLTTTSVAPAIQPTAARPDGNPGSARSVEAVAGRGPSDANGEASPRTPGGGPTGRQRADWAEMQKQWDKDGDGQLNEEERAAMRAAMQQRFGQGGGEGRRRPGGENAGSGETGNFQGSGERPRRNRGGEEGEARPRERRPAAETEQP